MRRTAALGWVSLSLLSSCGGASPEAPPPAPYVALHIAPPPAPFAPAPPSLVVVPRAEASPRRVPEPRDPKVRALRSEGNQHALQRIADGIVVMSKERGVLGFLKGPLPGAEIRWAGFVDEDAILVATNESLHRAATPDDAIAGKLEPLEKLDPAATKIASGGKRVVAAVPGADGAFYESRDGGRHFAPSKRPERGPLAGLAVRSDGVIVVAIEKETFTSDRGAKGIRAQVFVEGRGNAWSKGPLTETFHGPVIQQQGDTIAVNSPLKPGDPSSFRHLGLDAKGKWIDAEYGDSWLNFAWADTRFNPGLPMDRPGFPKPRLKTDEDDLDGIEGGVAGGVPGGLLMVTCRGVDCLARRSAIGATPGVRVFQDGECGVKAQQWCDTARPVQRAATLLVRDGGDRRVVRLPSSCASGRILGTERAAFVYCNGKYQGRPAIHHVAPSGVLTEVVSGAPRDLANFGAESASDGTSVLFTDKANWVCRTAGAPACAAVALEGFLGARPLPGGRALVARRGASERELALELAGEAGAAPLRVTLQANLLEIEVTAEGYIRLWTSATLTSRSSAESLARRNGSPPLDAFLVRSDGQLVPDAAAK
jgi:hypothetical protein